MLRAPVRIAAVALAGAVVLVALVVFAGGDPQGHRLVVEIPSAGGVVPGQYVRAAGRKVGEVEKAEVTPRHTARLTLRITDEKAWPLPADSSFQIRIGGTVRASDRFVALTPGRAGGPMLTDGGTIPAARFTTPFEVDQLVGLFDTESRADLRRLLRAGGAAFGPGASPELRGALDVAPPAVGQASDLLGDLASNPSGLSHLVESADRVVASVNRANPRVGELLADAATTFTAVGSEADALRRGLEGGARATTTLRTTLDHADTTLDAAATLTRRLRPGVTELLRTASPLRSTLSTVVDIGPDAEQTLRTARTNAPSITSLLDVATPLMPRLESVGRQAAKQLDCVRPYAPEVAGFVTTWGNGFGGQDGKDHFLRAEVGTYPYSNASPLNSEQLVDSLPGLHVINPRPPGVSANQPWLLPECGITEKAFSAKDDPENDASALYPPGLLDRADNPDPEKNR